MVKESLSLSISKFEVIKSDPRFLYCDFWFALVGENSNGSVIEKEAYEYAKPTIEYLPICGKFKNKDFMAHEEDEKPLGTILTLNDNNYRYEIAENGKEYVVVSGIIYKDYCQKESDKILSDGIKKTSIELEVEKKTNLSNGKIRIDKFNYRCVTILGNSYKEGMSGCHLEVIDENPKQKYSEFINRIKFELSEDSETHLNNEEMEKEDGLMEVVEIKEVAEVAEIKHAEVENIEDPIKAEITSNFELTTMQLYDVIRKELCKNTYYEEYCGESYECNKYWLKDFDSEFIYVFDCEKGIDSKIPYVKNNDDIILDYENSKRIKYVPTDWEDGTTIEEDELKTEFSNIIKSFKENIISKINTKNSNLLSEKEKQFVEEKELLVKEIETKNNEINVKDTEISTKVDEYLELNKKFTLLNEKVELEAVELERLKKFESDLKVKEVNDKVETLFAEYADVLTNEDIALFKGEVDNIESFELFEQKVKSFACDRYKQKNKNKDINNTINFSHVETFKTKSTAKTVNRWAVYSEEYKINK